MLFGRIGRTGDTEIDTLTTSTVDLSLPGQDDHTVVQCKLDTTLRRGECTHVALVVCKLACGSLLIQSLLAVYKVVLRGTSKTLSKCSRMPIGSRSNLDKIDTTLMADNITHKQIHPEHGRRVTQIIHNLAATPHPLTCPVQPLAGSKQMYMYCK